MIIGSPRTLRRKESAAHVVPINAAIAPGWIYASWSGRFWYKRTYALSYRKTRSGRLPTPNDRQLSTHPGSEPDSRLPANRGHLHARYPFKLLVAGGPLIEGILRRVMGPTKIHQALCRGGSVLRKRGGFYTEPAFNA